MNIYFLKENVVFQKIFNLILDKKIKFFIYDVKV